ncbi:MAG: hypothetical protein AAGH74_05175 [Pseudomonadota bacterium]
MKLYFRKRDHGAFAFRLDVENRQRRLEMIHIATINGTDIRPQQGCPPTQAEIQEIEEWIAGQTGHRPDCEAEQAINEINLLAHWIANEAGDDEILAFSDPMLLAMHDLRQVIVQRLAEVGAPRASGTE